MSTTFHLSIGSHLAFSADQQQYRRVEYCYYHVSFPGAHAALSSTPSWPFVQPRILPNTHNVPASQHLVHRDSNLPILRAHVAPNPQSYPAAWRPGASLRSITGPTLLVHLRLPYKETRSTRDTNGSLPHHTALKTMATAVSSNEDQAPSPQVPAKPLIDDNNGPANDSKVADSPSAESQMEAKDGPAAKSGKKGSNARDTKNTNSSKQGRKRTKTGCLSKSSQHPCLTGQLILS